MGEIKKDRPQLIASVLCKFVIDPHHGFRTIQNLPKESNPRLHRRGVTQTSTDSARRTLFSSVWFRRHSSYAGQGQFVSGNGYRHGSSVSGRYIRSRGIGAPWSG